MPKLTSSGKPTIGYIRELYRKNPTELTVQEKIILDEFSQEFNALVVEPLRANYKAIVLPTIHNFQQLNQSYLSMAIETQKSLTIFNSEFNQQLKSLLTLGSSIKIAIDSATSFASLFKNAYDQTSYFTTLINKTMLMPELGKAIIDIEGGFKITFNNFNQIDSSLSAFSLEGKVTNTTEIGLVNVTSHSSLELKVQHLEAKLDQLTLENRQLLNKIYDEVKNDEKTKLLVIDDLTYIKDDFILSIAGNKVSIKPGSIQADLCSFILKNTKTAGKEWSLDEIVPKVFSVPYDESDEKDWDEKVRNLTRHLNENISKNTSPLKDGLFKYSNGVLTLNKKIFEK